MTTIRRLELGLRALTVAFLGLGTLALLRSPEVPPGETLPQGLDSPAPAPARHAVTLPDAAAAELVIASNIFSSSRRAPATRYDPYAPPPDPYAPTLQEYGTPEPMADAPDPDAVPRLFGIVTGPAGPAALLRLDPASPQARLYRAGERGAAYRVEKIEGQEVVLVGPSGRIVLRLAPPPGQGGP
jgi:hypothetical protein